MRRAWIVLLLAGCSRAPSPTRTSVVSALSAPPPAGFLRAEGPRSFSFPEDHGPHPGFRTEWWYVTGNLRSAGGRRFGFELTIFRSQLASKASVRRSKWAANDAYMAHFAVTDVDGRRFYSRERDARGAQGLAGASTERVWVEDWSIEGGREFPSRLRAGDGGLSVELELRPERPVVLNGDRGLSRKSGGPGDASYYYSIPRLKSSGKLTIDGKAFEVAGLSWLDREWGTSALSHEQAGWDWFALHLADGRDLMYYRLRLKDGSTDAHSAGTLISRDGRSKPLAAGDVRLEPSGRWNAYPASWRLSIPSEGLSFDLKPWLEDQELDVSFRYWEGAVGAPGAEGYVEMTGYGS